MAVQVNFLLGLFKGKKNLKDTQVIETYLQAMKEIKKETENIYVSVSSTKYILGHLHHLVKQNGWAHTYLGYRLQMKIEKTFRQVKNISTSNMNIPVWGYFDLQGIGNQNQPVTEPLVS